MRSRAGFRPSGARVSPTSNVKAKGVCVIPNAAMGVGQTRLHGFYDGAFGSRPDFNGWFKPAIDKVRVLGGNAARITGPHGILAAGSDDGATPRQAMDNVRRLLDYAASVNFLIYWQTMIKTGDGTQQQNTDAAALMARTLNDYPNILGIDLWNEPDAAGAGTQLQVGTYAAAAFPAVRAVTSIPLTISLGGAPASWATHPYASTLAPYVDFWDFHNYAMASAPSTVYSGLASWRASPYYRPWLCGESGAPFVSGSGFTGGSAQQSAVYSNLALLSAEPDCRGVFAFCLTDYDGSQWGFYDGSQVGPRSQVSSPFTASFARQD